LVAAASRREVKPVLLFFPLLTLMADAARVIEIRVRMMALGQGSPGEMTLMVAEKVKAMQEARAIIARGGDSSRVIENYQRIVAANVARLSKPRGD
jgi:hypothetical protein